MTQINSLVELAQAIEAGVGVEGIATQTWQHIEALKQGLEKGRIRIKPKTKVIDMTPFIENGLDVCFGDRPDQCYFIGTLKAIHKSEQLVDLHQDQTNSEWKFCQPRLNHPFIWENQELPEGLVVEYGLFFEQERKIKWASRPYHATCVARITGCKEGYCFAGEEGE
jgi:hypothetical protein